MFVAVLSDRPDLREAFCRSLGKVETAGELAFYSAEHEGKCITLIDPVQYPERIQPLLHSLSMADYVVLVVDALTPKIGEIIVAVNSLKLDKGVIISKSALPLGGTALEKFDKVADSEGAKAKVLSFQRDAPGEAVLALADRTENVSGMGNVAHCALRSGKLKKADKLFLLPEKKDLEARSLMLGRGEVEEVSAGARFSMAYRGDAFERGLLVPIRHEHEIGNVINGRFIKSPFYKDELKGKIHAYTNLQFVEGHLNENDLTLSQPIAYEKGELILVVDASNQKLRIAGAFQSKW
jgi:selenocysteine-specific translation elongation factor